jgi:hypothetical protein
MMPQDKETPSPLRAAVAAAVGAYEPHHHTANEAMGRALLAWYRALPITDEHVEAVARKLMATTIGREDAWELEGKSYLHNGYLRAAHSAIQASRDHVIRELEKL